MPSSDYSSAIGGGLKLKGSSSGIDKSKKKKKKSSKPTTESDNNEKPATKDPETSQSALQKALADTDDTSKSPDATEITTYGKTEAQRRYEERRKKRLEERLQREGVKTHKERVQELNKYLSTLSEHNDMPRIGPG
ncbi:hypothetical protein CKM354_000376200 [Cercospora kikuchii]|uniref:DUF1754-domain-containing protein n=1 Tax=Cercospora kikuchii TaxID=84275 RepID=A0A9P3FFE8_9PEZI|nr:uncharacterized protein CKM354_000376200 [Cercospora kikuchii]GIZ40425.1 hypothetical protein CKM354_000376200 [Cercospora kikuchii]